MPFLTTGSNTLLPAAPTAFGTPSQGPTQNF